MGDWTSIAFGSIYFALRKLAEEGFIRDPSLPQSGPAFNSNYAIVKERSKVMLVVPRTFFQTYRGYDFMRLKTCKTVGRKLHAK